MFDYIISDSERSVRDEVRSFVKDEVPHSLLKKMDQDEIQYPTEYVENLAKHNLIGLRFPEKYGGRGLDWKHEVVALEEIGVLGMSLGCLYSLVSICGEALNVFGNEDQKQRYLVPMLKGEKFTAEALTEPRGGSDFFGATTTAVKEGDHYILNGQKRFVVGAEGADFFLVYAKTDPKASPHESISLFLVDRTDGVDTEYVYGLMGTRGGGAGRLKFTDVEVPKENLIGQEGSGGKIFYQMMVPERMTTAAGILGTARACLRVAAKYSSKRKAFGQVIKKFEAVSFKVAEGITLLDAARNQVYNTATAIDNGAPPSVQRRFVSESKKFSTEKCWEVVNLAMQVMGGIGYSTVYPIERLLRDARLSMIWTGTSEIMSLIIQHEYYKELLSEKWLGRDIEQDALDPQDEEKDFG
ncbi:MAG: acyl-CoA dehydrogenase [Candidatus Lokiarchaeota archaeon]|nr:acyl-CoA dehydrogenase [Candidatus Lokiarchaeota archaeon]MBD3199350.1 acyl-CoA dehydrogenase [Candidatus Lokiarchaeota archaeon]